MVLRSAVSDTQFSLSPRRCAQPNADLPSWCVAICLLSLAVLTVIVQEQWLSIHYLETTQLARHNAVLNDTAWNPWNYRVLSEWLVEPLLRFCRSLRIGHPEAVGFLTARVLQNVAIFGVIWIYYRRLSLTNQQIVIALLILSFCFMHSLVNSDLSFNTYFDLLFYVIAAALVIHRRFFLLIPLAALAALNRETGAMIPVLAVTPLLFKEGRDLPDVRKRLTASGLGLLSFFVVYFVIRLELHKDVDGWTTRWGNEPGIPTLLHNVKDFRTLLYVAITVSVMPLVSWIQLRRVPIHLKALWWALVPLWFVFHFLFTYTDETRYYLMPIAVAMLPALLWSAENDRRTGSLLSC